MVTRPDPVHAPRLRRLPDRLSLLGVRAGQLIAWQLIAVTGAFAATQRGPGRWAFALLAVIGCCLTLPRWQHRWAYEWLATAWGYRRARANHVPLAGQAVASPAIEVIPVRARNGREAGVVHDGDGFAVIVGVTADPTGPQVTELPVAALCGMLDPQDMMVSAVQVVLHADLAASDVASDLTAAYQNLGYHRVPRSQSAWIALRHDPAASGYAVATAGTAPAEQHASFLRALAGRGTRAIDQLPGALRGQLADARSARVLLSTALLSPDAASGAAPATDPRPPRRWAAWHSATRRHVTYWLKRWPAGGLPALQQALMTIPALSVTTAIVLRRAETGRVELTATIRVAAGPDVPASDLQHAVADAAARCGARLVPLHGAHGTGVLATLPLGRRPEPPGGWLGRHAGSAPASTLATVMPVAWGGVVLGTEASGEPAAVPFFTAERGTRTAVIGAAALPRLIALRAVGTGARLQIVTSRPREWLRLRSYARLPAERMAVVRPGTAPPTDGTRAAPWMIVDDSGAPAAAAGGPWQAVVAVPAADAVTVAALRGLDAIILQRSTPACRGAVVAALNLPVPAARSLHGIPGDVVAIASPGTVRLVPLTPDKSERALLLASMQAGPPLPG